MIPDDILFMGTPPPPNWKALSEN